MNYCMCNRRGDNRRMFQEAEERKYADATIRDCMGVIVYIINNLNSVPFIALKTVLNRFLI